MRPLLGWSADQLGRFGLAAPAFRVFERLQSLWAPSAPGLPPARLRVLTAGTADPAAFVLVGVAAAADIAHAAEAGGLPLEACASVLEFGCGCGRVAHELIPRIAPGRFSGCDLNTDLVAWCHANLAGEFNATAPRPPLPYDSGHFDLVYAVSVFTHLTEEGACAWLAELARVVRTDGLAVLTFHDDCNPSATAFAADLAVEGFHLKRGGVEGSNLMTGFFTPAGLAARAAPGWTPVHVVSSPDARSGQAVAVFRRTGAACA